MLRSWFDSSASARATRPTAVAGSVRRGYLLSGDALPPPTIDQVRDQRARRVGALDGADVDTLFGLSFASVNRAQQFMLAIKGLFLDHKLHLVDAVMVVKDSNQRVRVRETIDPQPGRSALMGAMWIGFLGLIVGGSVGWLVGIGLGATVGVVLAKVIDRGVPDEWVDWFKSAARPSSATVIVLATRIDQRALRAEIDRFPGARLVHSTLRADAFSQLRSAFNDHAPSGFRDSEV